MKNVFVHFFISLFLLFPSFICAQFHSDQLEKSEQEFCQSINSNFLDKLKTSDKNFIISKYLEHNVISQIISYNGLQGKLLISGANTSYPLARWEAVNNTEYLKISFYNTNKPIECTYTTNHNTANKFLEELKRELNEDIYRICLISQANNKFETVKNNENNLSDSKHLKFEQIRSSKDLPEGLQDVLSSNSLKKKCSQEELQQDIEELSTNADSNAKRKRTVRSVSHWFMVPNTKWCGRGHDASNYTELGGASMADKCCRKHDHCNINIPGFTTKWQLFNYFPFTISHCSCDKRFRTCLKMADSADANMVGKLFFNIVQTKCFVFKTEKVCRKHSWRGKCERKELRKRAHIRDNRKF